MRKVFWIILSTALLSGSVHSQESRGAQKPSSTDWEQLAKRKNTIYLYKPNQVRRVGSSVKFWVKYLPSDENARIAAIKHYSELYKTSRTDFSNYGYTLVYWEFNCSEMKSRVIGIANYEASGKVIISKDLNNREWDNVIPDSLGEHFANTVCK